MKPHKSSFDPDSAESRLKLNAVLKSTLSLRNATHAPATDKKLRRIFASIARITAAMRAGRSPAARKAAFFKFLAKLDQLANLRDEMHPALLHEISLFMKKFYESFSGEKLTVKSSSASGISYAASAAAKCRATK